MKKQKRDFKVYVCTFRKEGMTFQSLFVYFPELTDKLERQRDSHSQLLAQKQAYIDQHEKHIEQMNEDCLRDVQKKTVEAEQNMAAEWRASRYTQELKERCKEASVELDNLLQEHLKLEQAARQKRLKTETQLLTWIKKYDNDMGDRQDVYDELKKRM